jgi:flagellin-like protein
MKGISSLIAAVLLIAFVISIAVLVSTFLTAISQTAQKDTGEKQEEVLKATKASIEIVNMKHNNDTGNLTVTVRNTGSVKLENVTVNIYGDNLVHDKFVQSLKTQEVTQFILQVGGAEGIDRVEVAAENPTVTATQKFEKAETGSPPSAPTDLTVS